MLLQYWNVTVQLLFLFLPFIFISIITVKYNVKLGSIQKRILAAEGINAVRYVKLFWGGEKKQIDSDELVKLVFLHFSASAGGCSWALQALLAMNNGVADLFFLFFPSLKKMLNRCLAFVIILAPPTVPIETTPYITKTNRSLWFWGYFTFQYKLLCTELHFIQTVHLKKRKVIS